MRGEGIKDQKEFKMMEGEVCWMTSEARVKWRGNEDMKRRINTNTDLIACRDRREISSSFTVNDRGNGGGSDRGKDSLFGNEPVGKM